MVKHGGKWREKHVKNHVKIGAWEIIPSPEKLDSLHKKAAPRSIPGRRVLLIKIIPGQDQKADKIN